MTESTSSEASHTESVSAPTESVPTESTPPEEQYESEGAPDIPPLLAGEASYTGTSNDALAYLREQDGSDLPMAVLESRADVDAFLAACPETAAVANFTEYDEQWFAERHLAVLYVSDSGSPQYLLEGEQLTERDGILTATILIRYRQPMMVNQNWLQFLILIPVNAAVPQYVRITNRILNGSKMENHYHDEPVDPVLKANSVGSSSNPVEVSLLRTQSLEDIRPATATGEAAREIRDFFDHLVYDPDKVCSCVVDSNWMNMGTIFSINDTYYLYSGGGWFVRCEEGQAYLTRDQAEYIIELLYGVLYDGAVDYSLAHQTIDLMEKGDTAFASYTPAELTERWITGWHKAEKTTPVLTLNSKADVTALLSEGKGETFRDYLEGLTDADFAGKTLLLGEFITGNCHREYILKSMELRDGKLTLRLGCASTCEEEALGTWGALIWMHKPFAATLSEIEMVAEEYTVISLAFGGSAFRTDYISAEDEEFAPIFDKALNADSIGYGRGAACALFAFSTVEELDAFRELSESLLSPYYGGDGFLSDPYLDRCDQDYFEDYALFAVYVELGSGSDTCSADQILQGGNSLCFYVDVNYAECGTDDMAGWFAVFTVPKSWLDDRLTYDAYRY